MALFFVPRRVFVPSSSTLRVSSRSFSCYSVLRNDKPAFAFGRGPAPPRLPKEEQELFEELQRRSTGAFSTPRAPPKVNQSPHSQPAAEEKPEFKATDKGEELHPDLRHSLKPEFEGEKNPKTGEVGGPKNEPLRWGAEGDWSYGGRVTDF
ncbi:putative mitochondrial protein, conserved [Aspergillus pseudoviridinutans]|uniref:Succinate dehydrogenase assembly factor 4, mitochondrial n=1 Tax=Aspergillus pseudoviridinutans TaxID=1517512 RepID=A0A9P3BGI3_9EURO|nr:putative mitochondrial protein, conserved [Aspergillus pseudoviridinutans]GIJ88890.1 putative mitochondrial protein, conserved [Aspergillus pseudoviridinutans]